MGVLEKARLLLPDAAEGLLSFAVSLTEDSIKNYCHLDQVPQELENTAAAMVLDAWRQAQFGEALEGQAKGITRGDVSFSFTTPAEQIQSMLAQPVFVQQYEKQLNAFRKVRW